MTPLQHPLSPYSPRVTLSTAPYLLRSRFSIGLLHSLNMPMISNQLISLCRRCAVPTSPPFLPRCHARIPLRHARIPLVVSRLSSTTPSSSTLVVSGELEEFPLSTSDFREFASLDWHTSTGRNISPSFKRRQQMFSSFAAPGDSESRSPSRCCDTSMDSSFATNTTSFSRYVDVECSQGKICMHISLMLKLGSRRR